MKSKGTYKVDTVFALSQFFGMPVNQVKVCLKRMGKEMATIQEFGEYLDSVPVTAIRLAGPTPGGESIEVWRGNVRVTYRVSSKKRAEFEEKLKDLYGRIGL
jgi:hypothetical protein